MVHIRDKSKIGEWDHIILDISSRSRAPRLKLLRGTLSQFQVKAITLVHNLMAVHCWKWINQTSTGKCINNLVLGSQLLEVCNRILSWFTASGWLDGIRNIVSEIKRFGCHRYGQDLP